MMFRRFTDGELVYPHESGRSLEPTPSGNRAIIAGRKAMTVTALPITPARRFWLLGPVGNYPHALLKTTTLSSLRISTSCDLVILLSAVNVAIAWSLRELFGTKRCLCRRRLLSP